jgi:plastocyanin
MHFSKYTLAAAALASSVFAQKVKVHVVKVSATTNTLTFTPNNLTAAVGEMVQFQFGVGNHTVTQSTFDAPCVPVGDVSNVTGIYSGFMPVAANAQRVPTYTVPITSTTPMWLYCAQGRHCQSGMVMVINEKCVPSHSASPFRSFSFWVCLY